MFCGALRPASLAAVPGAAGAGWHRKMEGSGEKQLSPCVGTPGARDRVGFAWVMEQKGTDDK